MKTGFRGAFVMSWSQTELDGEWTAPLEGLRVGATWNWTGEVVRVDGPAGVLPLGAAEGMTDLRRRAAHSVRRLVATAVTGVTEAVADAPLMADRGFTLTDGHGTWSATLIETLPGRPPLVLFLDEIPPRHCDLWVVSHSLGEMTGEGPGAAAGGVICFTPGTMILTDEGPRPVEEIAEGDRVQTKDSGCREILWVGRRRVSGARLHAMPHLAPVRMREGALDRGVPDAGLLVSPDHRMVLRGPRARALFNTDEVLVAARDLINDRTVLVERGVREVTYIHLLLPRHEIVFANGVETESFHPASAALSTLEDRQLSELFARLPEVSTDPQSYGAYARRVLDRSEAAILRHDMAA